MADDALEAVLHLAEFAHFDRNRDLDLSNDPVALRVAQLPAGFRFEPAEADNSCVFAEIHAPLDRGKDSAEETLAIVPVLRISRNAKPDCLRLIPAITRTGLCSIGGEVFSVVLSQYERITGRFNDPLTGLFLTHCASGRHENRWSWKGADLLGAMRR